MNAKEKLQTALAHKSAESIPVDFGSTAVTGIHVLAISRLREYYGLPRQAVKVIEPYQMLGEVAADLRQAMGIDVVGITPRNNMFGFENSNWKEFNTFWGQKVLVPGNFNTTIDEQGDLLIFPEGDPAAPASGKMPKASFFFDTIIRQQPIDEAALNYLDNCEEFKPISPEDLAWWKQRTHESGLAETGVVATFGGTALGDIALVPTPNLKNPKGIRDISEWYMSTLIRPDYVHAIFEYQTRQALENLQKIKEVIAPVIDAVFICGTDFGTQDSQFCSDELFRELYMPYYKQINNWIHTNTTWKTFKHSCGAVEPLINLFSEAGFDILNPVQINAKGMNPQALKDKYGDQITFWGGGVDTQKVLPFASPAEVREQVLQNCEIFSRLGGFVFNSVHNIQANTPVENIVAMIDAVKEFNGR